MNELKVDDEIQRICRQIVAQGLDLHQWAQRESDDMFQTEHYSGGYESSDRAFCFSHYDKAGEERWFGLTLEQVGQVARGEAVHIILRTPEP